MAKQSRDHIRGDHKAYMNFQSSRFYNYFNSLVEEIQELKNEGVAFLFFQTPLASRIVGLSEFEKDRIEHWEFDFNNISEKDCKIIKNIYPYDVSIQYLQEVYDGAKVFEKDGIKYLSDYESKYVNIINGTRLTHYQPQKHANNIYIYGQCTARGTGVEDKNTIASFLQKQINEQYPNSYQVENVAIGCGSDIHDDLSHMQKCKFHKGDIVILCTNLEIVPQFIFDQNEVAYYDCSSLFNRPHQYGEWFTDMPFHTNEIGNRVIAQYIYQILQNRDLIYDKSNEEKIELYSNYNENSNIDIQEIEKYINDVNKIWNRSGVCGGIVMNCNPFTLGHLYLIETAASQVDHLCIFVVEENKSYFPFADRIELVKRGTKHIKNVCIVPSGKYIISAVTFPGYFYKDGNTEIEVDTSKDIHIFGKYLAPKLGLSKRFVGEEPNDYVTRKYNETMKQLLPAYNIEVIEIPRKETDGEVISASLVRKYLENKDFTLISKLVPKSTYDYLKEKYD